MTKENTSTGERAAVETASNAPKEREKPSNAPVVVPAEQTAHQGSALRSRQPTSLTTKQSEDSIAAQKSCYPSPPPPPPPPPKTTAQQHARPPPPPPPKTTAQQHPPPPSLPRPPPPPPLPPPQTTVHQHPRPPPPSVNAAESSIRTGETNSKSSKNGSSSSDKPPLPAKGQPKSSATKQSKDSIAAPAQELPPPPPPHRTKVQQHHQQHRPPQSHASVNAAGSFIPRGETNSKNGSSSSSSDKPPLPAKGQPKSSATKQSKDSIAAPPQKPTSNQHPPPPFRSQQQPSTATKQSGNSTTAPAQKPKAHHPPPLHRTKVHKHQQDDTSANAEDIPISNEVTSSRRSSDKPPLLSATALVEGSEMVISQQSDSSSSLKFVSGNAVDRGSPLTVAAELPPDAPNATSGNSVTSPAVDDANEIDARDAGGRLPNPADIATTPTRSASYGLKMYDIVTPVSDIVPTRDVDTVQLNRMEQGELVAHDADGDGVISPNSGDGARSDFMGLNTAENSFLYKMERGEVVDDHTSVDTTHSRSSTQHTSSGGLLSSSPAPPLLTPTSSAQQRADGGSGIQVGRASLPPVTTAYSAENLQAKTRSRDHPQDLDTIMLSAATQGACSMGQESNDDQLKLPDGSNPSNIASLLQESPDQVVCPDEGVVGSFSSPSVSSSTDSATQNNHGFSIVIASDSAKHDHKPSRDPHTPSDHRSPSKLSSDTGASRVSDHASANHRVSAVDKTSETSLKGSETSKSDVDFRSEYVDHKGMAKQDNESNCGFGEGLGHANGITAAHGNAVRTEEKAVVNLHKIGIQNHSLSDAPRANHATTPHLPPNTSISDVAVTMSSIATPLEASDTPGNCIQDPIDSVTVASAKSLVESDPVNFATGPSQGEREASAHFDTTVPENDSVTSISGATTSPKSSSKNSSITLANKSSDHDDVNALVGDNYYCATSRSSSCPHPSDEDTATQPKSFESLVGSRVSSQDFTDAFSMENEKEPTLGDDILPHTQSGDTLSYLDVESSPPMSIAPAERQCYVQTPRASNDPIEMARSSYEFPSDENNTGQSASESTLGTPVPIEVSVGTCNNISPLLDPPTLYENSKAPLLNNGVGGPTFASEEMTDNSFVQLNEKRPGGVKSQSGSHSSSHLSLVWEYSSASSTKETPVSYHNNGANSALSFEDGHRGSDVASFSNSGSLSSEVTPTTSDKCHYECTSEEDAPISQSDQNADVIEMYGGQVRDDSEETEELDEIANSSETSNLVALAPPSMSAVVEAVVSLFVTASADSWKDEVFVEGLGVATDGSYYFELKLVEKSKKRKAPLDIVLEAVFKMRCSFPRPLQEALEELSSENCLTTRRNTRSITEAQERKFFVDTLVRYAHSQAQKALESQGAVRCSSVYVTYAGTAQCLFMHVHKPLWECTTVMEKRHRPPLIFQKAKDITTFKDLQASSESFRNLPLTLCRAIKGDKRCRRLVKTHGNLLAGRDAFEQIPEADDEPLKVGTAHCVRGDIWHKSRVESRSCMLYCVARPEGEQNLDQSSESCGQTEASDEDADDSVVVGGALYHRTAIIADITEELWTKCNDLDENALLALMELLQMSIGESGCNVPVTIYKALGEESDLGNLAKACKEMYESTQKNYKARQLLTHTAAAKAKTNSSSL